MKPKIILHCGVPDVSLVAFQQMLADNRRQLLKAGVYFPEKARKQRSSYDLRHLLSEILMPANNNQTSLYRIDDIIGKIAAESKPHTLLIADDDLLDKAFSRRYDMFYGDIDAMAKRLRLALDGYVVEFRLIIRDYATFLPSWYQASVKGGSTLTFDEFLEAYDFDSVTWKRPIKALHTYFGAENVTVFDYSDLERNPRAFLAAIFPEVMDVLGDKVDDLHGKVKPVGMDLLDIYRQWNVVADRLSISPAMRDIVRRAGRRLALPLLERFSKGGQLSLPPAMAAEMSARYAEDLLSIRPCHVASDDVDEFKHAAQ